MKNKEHKDKVGIHCPHLKKWFVVHAICIDTITCEICKKEIKDKYNNEKR